MAQKLARLGLVEPMDLVLHLPLRYEDETRITAIADAPISTACRSKARCASARCAGSRANSCACCWPTPAARVAALSAFLSQPGKTLRRRPAPAQWVGEVRRGFQGDEMVHLKTTPLATTMLPEAMTRSTPPCGG